MLNRKNKLQVL